MSFKSVLALAVIIVCTMFAILVIEITENSITIGGQTKTKTVDNNI